MKLRYKIALRNLYISQAIIILFLLFAYFVWFPHSFTELGGFYRTARMLIFVDLVLGPLLVFFIYKENKKYLKFDINVLLTIQLIAFFFGAHSLYLKHPAYAVFDTDKFVITNVSNIYPKPTWSEQFKYFFSKPSFVITEPPKDPDELNALAMEIVFSGQPDIDSRPKYFSPLHDHIDFIIDKSIKYEELDIQFQKSLKQVSKKLGGNINDFAFLPLTGNNQKNMIWVFDRITFKPVEIIDIDSWKFKVASNQLSK